MVERAPVGLPPDPEKLGLLRLDGREAAARSCSK